ncbi:MAG: hypothetical protein WD314_00660, partial [Trueperaceae bacterium]
SSEGGQVKLPKIAALRPKFGIGIVIGAAILLVSSASGSDPALGLVLGSGAGIALGLTRGAGPDGLAGGDDERPGDGD